MLTFKSVVHAALFTATLTASSALTAAESEFYFKVANQTASKIKRLEVSENKKTWGQFDIGGGIAVGQTMTLVWDASTDNEDCVQWIRATFADGSTSDPNRFDFCEDLDEPIVFGD